MPTLKPQHRPSWLGKRDIKPFGSDKFYESTPWRKFRRIYIRDHPLCVECEKEGKITEAKIVDHIKPLTQGGERYDYNNLQSLCNVCHNKKRGRESHGNFT